MNSLSVAVSEGNLYFVFVLKDVSSGFRALGSQDFSAFGTSLVPHPLLASVVSDG